MKVSLSGVVLGLSLLAVGCSAGPSPFTPSMPEDSVFAPYNCAVKPAALAGQPPAPGTAAANTAFPGTVSLVTVSPGTVPPDMVAAQGWNAPHVPGKVLVDTGRLSAQNLGRLQGLTVSSVTPHLKAVQTPSGQTDQALAQKLAQAGLHVQPDYLYQALSAPNDPGFPGNAGITVAGVKYTQTYLTRTRVPQAWDVLAQRKLPLSGALTALLDTAVDAAHADLQGRVALNVSHIKALTPGDSHTCNHATAAAGIIGATGHNGVGVTGVGQQQALLTQEVMTADGASTSTVATALAYAVKRGAKVINISLGRSTNPGDAALDQALSRAANSAVIVAAAGNTATDVYYPASHPSVIAVGAVGNRDGVLAAYSARPSGPQERPLDIVAPGGDYGSPLLTLAPHSSYTTMAGTSFAAPQVAGVAALMQATNPNLSAAQTRALLLAHVNRAAGLPMLDAAAAVTAALAGK